MKKLFALMLALALICPAAIATQAVPDGDRQADTLISATLNPGYTVLIPAEVAIPFNQTETPMTVQVLEMHLAIPEDSTKVSLLKVAVQPESGTLKHTGGTGAAIPYTIEAQEGQGSALLFDAAGDRVMNILIAPEAWNQAAGGAYADTVTFTITAETGDR